ncbi:ABC transporter permease family protein [Rhodoferax antarcticus]|nr:ABC-type lipoprotein release transport system permease subunit [Rhodoferax antarcticus]
MMTLSLAIRNLLRNRRRSLATLLAMAIGSTSILLFGGFSGNINLEMHTRSVMRGGHLQVQHSDFYVYGSGNPMAYSISHYQKILQDIRNDEVLKTMLVVATPTLQFGGIASNNAANVSRTILGTAFVPADINLMRRWNDFGLRSTAPVSALEGASPDSVNIGFGVARVLQLCTQLWIADCPPLHVSAAAVADAASIPDDIAELSALEAAPAAAKGPLPVIDVLVANSRGAPNVTSLKVVQAEDQGFKELDEVTIMTRLDHIQKLIYGQAEPKVTSVILQLQHTSQIPQARERLEPILARYAKDQPLSIKDFRELNPFFV